jgi:Polymorphic toxin system, DSP-PTPase phosphatase
VINYSLIQVRPGLYRGHEGPPPTPEQYQGLYEAGIRAVLCLTEKQEGEEEAAKKAGIYFIYRPWGEILPPTLSQLTIAALVEFNWVDYSEQEKGLLIHCTHQVDRTGAAILADRVSHCGWSFDKAYQEMLDAGHNIWFPPYRWWWKKRLRDFARRYGK